MRVYTAEHCVGRNALSVTRSWTVLIGFPVQQLVKWIAYADSPTEKYLLLRYNRNVIAPIEKARNYVGEAIRFRENEGK